MERLLRSQCELYNAALEERRGAWRWGAPVRIDGCLSNGAGAKSRLNRSIHDAGWGAIVSMPTRQRSGTPELRRRP